MELVSPQTMKGSIRDSKNDNLDSGIESDCVVCCEQPKSTLIVPCGHLILCWDCAQTLYESQKGCPGEQFTHLTTLQFAEQKFPKSTVLIGNNTKCT